MEGQTIFPTETPFIAEDQHSDIASELEEVFSQTGSEAPAASEAASTSTQSEKKERPFRIRPCKSVSDGSKCPHGKKCCYAHSIEELRLVPCKFGDKCRNKNRLCEFSHEKETTHDVANRCGWFRKVASTSQEHSSTSTPSTSSAPIHVSLFPPQAPATIPHQHLYANPATYVPPSGSRVARYMTGNSQPQQYFQNPAQHIIPPHNPHQQQFYHPQLPIPHQSQPEKHEIASDETVIRVPKELAEMAMRLALEKGKTNLRLEII